jgi:hypothetical protein
MSALHSNVDDWRSQIINLFERDSLLYCSKRLHNAKPTEWQSGAVEGTGVVQAEAETAKMTARDLEMADTVRSFSDPFD